MRYQLMLLACISAIFSGNVLSFSTPSTRTVGGGTSLDHYASRTSSSSLNMMNEFFDNLGKMFGNNDESSEQLTQQGSNIVNAEEVLRIPGEMTC